MIVSKFGYLEEPETEPCRRPGLIFDQFEVWLFRRTLWNLSGKNESVTLKYFPHIPMPLSLYKRPSCQILLSNDKSRKTFLTSTDGFALTALQMSWVIEMKWYTHELPGLNPDWLLLRRLLLFK